MGSDLSMEQASFRPRPPKVQWIDSHTILVETDVFYHGYREFYKGAYTREVAQILKSMGVKVPEYNMPEEIKQLATTLHNNFCKYDHTEGCGWGYEEGEWRRAKDHGWAKGMWNDDMRAHNRWRINAENVLDRMRKEGYSDEKVVEFIQGFNLIQKAIEGM
jgi:hypothetical protein